MVLPQLTPDEGADTSLSALPPARFRPPAGLVHSVALRSRRVNVVDSGNKKGFTTAQQNGLRYEAKVAKRLRSGLDYQVGAKYLDQPYLDFEDDLGPRVVIPDGLALLPGGLALVFEIKSQHMPEAWWQLRRLYQPVVRQLPFVSQVSVVEVVRSYDPAMGFPETVQLCTTLDQVLWSRPEPFKVLLWRM